MACLSRALLVVCAGACLSSTSAAPSGEAAAVWSEDDAACAIGELDSSCALSLRQLRARSMRDAPPEAQATGVVPADGADPMDEADEDDEIGIPGGWGEAADFADEEAELEQEDLNSSQLSRRHSWGSCAQYKCITYYNRRHGCQCNSACRNFGSCCPDYGDKCVKRPPAPAPATRAPATKAPAPTTAPSAEMGDAEAGDIKTLYHQTSSQAGPLILANGFRPGRVGYCGGAIYFAETPQATGGKAIGPDSHKGFMIEAKVNVGKVKDASHWCDRSRPPPSHTVWSGRKLAAAGYDCIKFNPGDGPEWVIYGNSRIVSMKRVPW